MPKIDVQRLSEDLYIQNTMMFSSSSNRDVSLMYQDPALNENSFLQNVVFQIEVDLKKRSAPYADIHTKSQFPDENEVLFMLGHRFKVQNVKFINEENHYLVKLLLLNNFEPIDVRTSNDYSPRRNLKNCISTLTYQMFYIPVTKLNIIYHEFMNLYPSERWIEAVKIYRYGQYLQLREQQPCLAIEKYHHALHIWDSFTNDDDLNCSIDICHQSLRSAHDTIEENFTQALTYYERAFNNFRSEYERTEICEHLTNIYAHQMELHYQDDQFMKQYGLKAIKYRKQYNEIICLNDPYDRLKVAENSYQKALDIYQQQDERDQSSINVCIDNIVQIYVEEKKDFKSAIVYQKLKHDFKLECNELEEDDDENTLRQKKRRIARSHRDLAELYKRNKQYSLASEHKKQANALDKDKQSDHTTTTCSFITMCITAVSNKFHT
ncbi:unnamed protein product [Adineta ricciae]|uniref:Uncharacterized protein n=1 Tax=Adineta ricciae TaxID=249248 RepID=A0A816CYL2_ADIRI|nr:unnamed protein product [Adineta ricciae]CAF1630257.1 unnamed protein product [Adineta ricciae]